MQYLVVEQPEDYYGGGIQPLEFHDNEESAEKAAEMYSEEEKKTRDPRLLGFMYHVMEVPVVSKGSYLVVKSVDDFCEREPVEVHGDEESAKRAAETYQAEEKRKWKYCASEYKVLFVKKV